MRTGFVVAFRRPVGPVYTAESGRAFIRNFFEYPAEMIAVGKSGYPGDFVNRAVIGQQQMAGLPDAGAGDIFSRRNIQMFSEHL